MDAYALYSLYRHSLLSQDLTDQCLSDWLRGVLFANERSFCDAWWFLLATFPHLVGPSGKVLGNIILIGALEGIIKRSLKSTFESMGA